MNIEKLFRWWGTVEVKGRDGEPATINGKPVILYQRVIGDAELSIARKKALKASRDLRSDLRDTDSEEHAAFLPDYEVLDDVALGNAVILAEFPEMRRRAENAMVRPKEPTIPNSEASLEEQEEYETALEEHEAQIKKLYEEKIEEFTNMRLERLKSKSREELERDFVEAAISSLCQGEMLKIFNAWCVYFGTYANKAMTKRAFDSYKVYDNIATDLKSQLIRSYLSLELSGGEAKK